MDWTPLWAAVAGPYAAACLLLVAAGAPKVADPMPLIRALRSAGLASPRALVRVVAGAEVGLGAAALLRPARLTAALVALAYLLFTVFVARVRRRGGVLAPCGCFGGPDTPATRTHLVFTATFSLVAAAVVVVPPGPEPWAAPLPVLLAAAGYAVVLALLAYLVMAVLPTVAARAVGARAAATGRG